jgi:putative redox protein
VLAILEKKRQAVSGLEVRAHGERAEDPPRIYTAIHVDYRVRGNDVQPKAVEDAIALSKGKYCSVSKMLENTARITTSYQIEAED